MIARMETVFAVQAWDAENQNWFSVDTRSQSPDEAVNRAKTMRSYAEPDQKFRAVKIFSTTEVIAE